MPAPQVFGGQELGAYGAGHGHVQPYSPPQQAYNPYAAYGHVPQERGVQVGYYTIDGYPIIGAGPMMGPGVPGSMLRFGAPPAGIANPYAPYMSSQQATMSTPQIVGGRQVSEWQPMMDRVLWLGFRFAGILSGANQPVSSQPQDTFAPRKVVIPGSVAPNFEVADLKIGAISQLSSSDPVPAEAFIPNASLTDVHFDTAKISQSVTFSVNNISNATATFRACLNGFVVR